MKRISIISIICCLLLSVAPSAYAQKKNGNPNREQWMKELREYKHNFLAKELGLSKDQQRRFFTLYDEMEDETNKVAAETKQIADRVEAAGAHATDADYDRAIDAITDQKAKEAEIEKTYMNKFKTILTKKQLFQLRGAERKYARDIMKHHRRLRSTDSKK